MIEEMSRPETETRLAQTQYAQPALFALHVALAELWRSWGIIPAAVLGHSVGEVAAAHVAGILTLEEAARVIVLRGRLMQRATGFGRMASLELDEEATERLLAGRAGCVRRGGQRSPVHRRLRRSGGGGGPPAGGGGPGRGPPSPAGGLRLPQSPDGPDRPGAGGRARDSTAAGRRDPHVLQHHRGAGTRPGDRRGALRAQCPRSRALRPGDRTSPPRGHRRLRRGRSPSRSRLRDRAVCRGGGRGVGAGVASPRPAGAGHDARDLERAVVSGRGAGLGGRPRPRPRRGPAPLPVEARAFPRPRPVQRLRPRRRRRSEAAGRGPPAAGLEAEDGAAPDDLRGGDR